MQLLMRGRLCADTVHKPVPRPPAPAEGQLPEVVALLVPFLHPTPQEAANNLLFLYVQYHRPLGFAKFVQYTQVRRSAAPRTSRWLATFTSPMAQYASPLSTMCL